MSYGADKQEIDTHRDPSRDTQTQAMTILEGQNWSQVKIDYVIDHVCENLSRPEKGMCWFGHRYIISELIYCIVMMIGVRQNKHSTS